MGAEMDLADDGGSRFEAYVDGLVSVIGHKDREGPLRDYCLGLMLPCERKSVEPLAAVTKPARVAAQHQSLLHFVGAGGWSDERVLAKVREVVLPAIERHGAISAWIIDDTSFPKQGRHSVGVARQYCGQLGKQDNCQVAVSLSLANRHASLPVAWRLYLPQEWADDPARRRKAGVPEDLVFKTKPEIALEQLRFACAAGLPRGVALLDAGYGNNSALRADITALGLTYAAGILSTTTVWAQGARPLPAKPWSGRGRPPKLMRRDDKHRPVAVKALALGLPKRAWRTIAWREGTAEPLRSRFARLRVRAAHRDEWRAELRAEWLLIEWPKGESEPTKYWLSTLPQNIAFADLVDFAKLRWRIERDYQELKQEVQAVPQNVGADVLLWWPETGPVERLAQHGIEDRRIDERGIRRLAGNEQDARRSTSTIPNIVDNGLAGVFGQRHAIVLLTFAADQDRTGPPVNVIKLDRNDLRRPQSEAGDEQKHRIVAPANWIIGPDRRNQLLDRLGAQVSGKVALRRQGNTRNGGHQIALRLAAPKQKSEHGTQMRWRRLVPVRFIAAPDFAQERDNVVRRNVIEIAGRLAKPERHEPVHEAVAGVNRAIAQSALVAEICRCRFGLCGRLQTILPSRTIRFGKTGQEISGALRVRRCRKDGAAVILERFEPCCDVRTRDPRAARRSNRDRLRGTPRQARPVPRRHWLLLVERAVQAGLGPSPVNALVAKGGVVGDGIAERLEGRHLHEILRDVVISPVSAVADISAGRGKERLGTGDALHCIRGLYGGHVVMRGQSVDLLDIENRVTLEKVNIPFQFLAGVGVGFGAGDGRRVNDKGPLLTLADMAFSSSACLKVIQIGAEGLCRKFRSDQHFVGNGFGYKADGE